MNSKIPIPKVGDDISANWASQVTQAVRNIGISSPSRALVRSGIYGTGFEPLPENQRNRRGGTYSDNGCFKLESRTKTVQSETVTVRAFTNMYFLMGPLLHSLNTSDTTKQNPCVEDFVCQGELEDDQEYTENDKPFVCLKILSPFTDNQQLKSELIGFKTIANLQAAQSEGENLIIPLYKFSHEGNVLVDFRNALFVDKGMTIVDNSGDMNEITNIRKLYLKTDVNSDIQFVAEKDDNSGHHSVTVGVSYV